MIGDDLISKKQFWALIGQGHENTSAKDGDNAGATEVVMKSPNGTRYKISVDGAGNLTTTAI